MHELLSVWRTVEPAGQLAIALCGVLMAYLLATAFRSPAPPRPRPLADDDAASWTDGYHTLDSYSKDRR